MYVFIYVCFYIHTHDVHIYTYVHIHSHTFTCVYAQGEHSCTRGDACTLMGTQASGLVWQICSEGPVWFW